MHGSKLRNKFLKLQSHESKLRYKKQRSLCIITLLRNVKKKYCTNFKKKFWKNVKLTFGNKNKGNKIIALEEGNEMITNDGKLA